MSMIVWHVVCGLGVCAYACLSFGVATAHGSTEPNSCFSVIKRPREGPELDHKLSAASLWKGRKDEECEARHKVQGTRSSVEPASSPLTILNSFDEERMLWLQLYDTMKVSTKERCLQTQCWKAVGMYVPDCAHDGRGFLARVRVCLRCSRRKWHSAVCVSSWKDREKRNAAAEYCSGGSSTHCLIQDMAKLRSFQSFSTRRSSTPEEKPLFFSWRKPRSPRLNSNVDRMQSPVWSNIMSIEMGKEEAVGKAGSTGRVGLKDTKSAEGETFACKYGCALAKASRALVEVKKNV